MEKAASAGVAKKSKRAVSPTQPFVPEPREEIDEFEDDEFENDPAEDAGEGDWEEFDPDDLVDVDPRAVGW